MHMRLTPRQKEMVDMFEQMSKEEQGRYCDDLFDG